MATFFEHNHFAVMSSGDKHEHPNMLHLANNLQIFYKCQHWYNLSDVNILMWTNLTDSTKIRYEYLGSEM